MPLPVTVQLRFPAQIAACGNEAAAVRLAGHSGYLLCPNPLTWSAKRNAQVVLAPVQLHTILLQPLSHPFILHKAGPGRMLTRLQYAWQYLHAARTCRRMQACYNNKQ